MHNIFSKIQSYNNSYEQNPRKNISISLWYKYNNKIASNKHWNCIFRT